MRRWRIHVRGTVQGVGFRPFVYRLAVRLGLSGFVFNDAAGVLIEIEGAAGEEFLVALRDEAPPLARIDGVDVIQISPEGNTGFAIRDSMATGDGTSSIGADVATCPACLAELFDPAGRFHLYPFVTCPDCGPRFTIAGRLPFDRAHTAMAGFAMCEACAADYADPASRRFHAETISCVRCGPRLSHSVARIAASLRAGQIVALKGIGGFHLLCDAANEEAVRNLRHRKRRADKPLAVMVADLASAERIGVPDEDERNLLACRARPIVLLRKGLGLAAGVAAGLDRVGVMLPSAPVHHLLFHALANSPALVATSANRAGNPLIVDDDEARRELEGVADVIVTHDRPILARSDDSVMQVIEGAARFVRRSRGFVPEPIDLGEDGPAVLAVGAHLKATLCVTRGREAFVSQHIGDLDNVQTVRFYRETAGRMLAMLGVRPELVACDLHPDYRSSLFAEELGRPLRRVQHHAAHLAAVAAEHHLRGAFVGVALDGHGYGADGGAWGGELMLMQGAMWRRGGHLWPLALPGGDLAAREPWRMGIAALVALGRGADMVFGHIPEAPRLAGWLAGSAAGPVTSSMGRLFDAAAALLGVCERQSYEGQAAMELEALVRVPRCLPDGFRIIENMLDFRPLLAGLLEPGMDARTGAEMFHGTLIAGLAEWTGAFARAEGQTDVVLGGGCLMNRVLAEGLAAALRARGLAVWLARAVPCNDGGISLGQAAMARVMI